MIRLLLVIALFLPDLRGEDKITFDDHVFPVFERSCLNCHNPDKTKGGLDLSNYQGTLRGSSGGKIVEPGDIGSKLIAVVKQTAEPKMPPEGDALDGQSIKLFEQWIAGGLLENSGSKAKKPSRPKFDTALQTDPTAKPEGPPPMPAHLVLEPSIVADRSSSIHAIENSPWAPLLAVTGQKQVLLFDTGKLQLAGILPFPEGDPTSLSFTPNGRYLIVGGGIPGKSGTTVTFDVIDGSRVLTVAKEFDTVLCADLRPDLAAVATGSPSKLVKMWKTEDGSRTASIKKHTDWVTSLDFSPDGILLATGDRNGGVWVWEALTGNEFHTLRAHQAGITASRFRGDSNLLATASEDGTVRFWEMTQGKEIRKIDAHPGGVLAFSWATDGSFATGGRDRAVRLWKADFGKIRDIAKLPDLPTAVALDTKSKRVFIADYTGRLLVHNSETGAKIAELDNNPPRIETRLQRIEDQIKAHPSELAGVKSAHEQTIAAVAQAEAVLQNKKVEIREARESVEASKRRLSEARSSETKLTQTINQLRTKIDGSRKQLDQWKAELEVKKKRKAELGAKITLAEQEAKDASDRLEKMRRSKDSEDKKKLVREAESRLRECQSSLASLNQSQQTTNHPTNPLMQRINQGTAALNTSNVRLKEFEGQLATRKGEIAKWAKASDQGQKRLDQLEAERKPLEEALGAKRKASQKSEAGLTRKREEMHRLEQQKEHWKRAVIRTEALETRRQAGAAQSHAEKLASEFSAIAQAVETTRAELHEKRTEWSEMKGVKLPDDPEICEEHAVVIRTIEAEINESVEALDQLEGQLNEHRTKLEEAIPAADRLDRRASSLDRRYFADTDTKK